MLFAGCELRGPATAPPPPTEVSTPITPATATPAEPASGDPAATTPAPGDTPPEAPAEESPGELLTATPDLVEAPNVLGRYLKPDREKHAGKIVETTGAIRFFYNYDDKAAASLSPVGELGALLGSLPCCFKTGFPWKTVLPGQVVTIRGRGVDGFAFSLVDCEIVKVEGVRPPEVTAVDLGKEIDADFQAAAAKYAAGTGWLMITGEADAPDGRSMTLKSGKVPLEVVNTDPPYKRQFADVKPGTAVRLVGKVEEMPTEEKFVITGAFLLPE